MKRMIGALALALTFAAVAPTATEAATPSNDEVEVYVVNHHDVRVRVFAEDQNGHLHSLGEVLRGEVQSLDVPAAVAAGAYRLKVVPAPQDIWSPVSDREALMTVPIAADQVDRVTLWVERELEMSDLEIQ